MSELERILPESKPIDTPTRRLPRPESQPLPAGWSREAGQFVHASGDLSIEDDFASRSDVDLAHAAKLARDTVALIEWEQRERALRRLISLRDDGPEAA